MLKPQCSPVHGNGTAPEDVVFQIGREPNRIDFLTSIDGVEFDEAWGDHLEAEIDGLTVRIIARDHLVKNKKALGRPRDLADVQELEREREDP